MEDVHGARSVEKERAMSASSVQLGVLLPTRGVLFATQGPPDVTPIYLMAEKAEEAGYHAIWVGDSVTAKPRLDALTTLGALAARTSRIRLCRPRSTDGDHSLCIAPTA